VPSFDNDVAMAVVNAELGRPWQEVYRELSPAPIAAASLGQVYKVSCCHCHVLVRL
jgi:aarF domain-containing kinase